MLSQTRHQRPPRPVDKATTLGQFCQARFSMSAHSWHGRPAPAWAGPGWPCHAPEATEPDKSGCAPHGTKADFSRRAPTGNAKRGNRGVRTFAKVQSGKGVASPATARVAWPLTIAPSGAVRDSMLKRQAQALIKIFLLYIQKSNSHAAANTASAEKRPPKEPSFAAMGLVKTPTSSLIGMMLLKM